MTASSFHEDERLRAWKAEAIVVLGEWEKAWEAAGRPGALGSSKAAATAAHIRRQAQRIRELDEALSDAEHRLSTPDPA